MLIDVSAGAGQLAAFVFSGGATAQSGSKINKLVKDILMKEGSKKAYELLKESIKDHVSKISKKQFIDRVNKEIDDETAHDFCSKISEKAYDLMINKKNVQQPKDLGEEWDTTGISKAAKKCDDENYNK